MGLISTKVKIRWNNKHKKYYESKGYIYTKAGDEFEVKIKDLLKDSHALVKVECDECGTKLSVEYRSYAKRNRNGTYYCGKNNNNCANKILLKGEGNGFYKKKHTKESRKKMKDHSWNKKHKGNLSPAWNPFLTKEERQRNRSKNPKYNNWVRSVFARDNYICQCCGQHQGNIEAHHLDSWNWCKEKRYNITNGITLCETCHKNFHSIYGYGNNTKEQFEKWIGYAINLLEYNGKLSTTKKIYCIEENKIYDSVKDLKDAWKLKTVVNIYEVCNKKKLNGYLRKSVNGKHILWLDEYLKMSKEDIDEYLLKYKINSVSNLKITYIYNDDILLFKGTRHDCSKWLVNNNFIGNIQSGSSTITKYIKNDKIYISKNKPDIHLYFTYNIK